VREPAGQGAGQVDVVLDQYLLLRASALLTVVEWAN
jgi:hypothetical protein